MTETLNSCNIVEWWKIDKERLSKLIKENLTLDPKCIYEWFYSILDHADAASWMCNLGEIDITKNKKWIIELYIQDYEISYKITKNKIDWPSYPKSKKTMLPKEFNDEKLKHSIILKILSSFKFMYETWEEVPVDPQQIESSAFDNVKKNEEDLKDAANKYLDQMDKLDEDENNKPIEITSSVWSFLSDLINEEYRADFLSNEKFQKWFDIIINFNKSKWIILPIEKIEKDWKVDYIFREKIKFYLVSLENIQD